MNIKSLKSLKLNNLTGLGYNKNEANWIKNLSKLLLLEHKNIVSGIHFNTLLCQEQNKFLSKISVESDDHSVSTDTYTETIITSVITNNYNTWSTNCVHLNYDMIFKYFYLNGYGYLGNKLLKYNFSQPAELKILQEFNIKKFKKSIDEYDLLKLLKIVDKSNY